MKGLAGYLQAAATQTADAFFRHQPQPEPTGERLNSVQIVAHRGIHGPGADENSFAAVDPLIGSGISMIEFDVRWTKDLEPVVYHDNTLKRVHQQNSLLNSFTLAELQAKFPTIPSLQQWVTRYHQHFALMIEFKSEYYPKPLKQNEKLAEIFCNITPATDYYCFSFDPELLQQLTFAPNRAKHIIGATKLDQLTKLAEQHQWGGIGSHYLTMRQQLIHYNKHAKRKISVGFPNSKNSLKREINRGADWLLCDNPIEMQQHLVEMRNNAR